MRSSIRLRTNCRSALAHEKEPTEPGKKPSLAVEGRLECLTRIVSVKHEDPEGPEEREKLKWKCLAVTRADQGLGIR